MQAWLNTSSSVPQTRSPWHLGPRPSGCRAVSSPAGHWPCCSTHLIRRFTASRLSDGSPLCGNTTHRANRCPPLVRHHKRHAVYNPSYSPARSHSWFAAFRELADQQERSMGYHANTAIQGRKQSCSFSRCLSPTQTTVRHERPRKQISVAGVFFYGKLHCEQASSGNRCRHWERLCKEKLYFCHNDI